MDKMKLFVIWLDGYMEACGPVLNKEQTNVVKEKLNGLFEHEADSMNIQEEPFHLGLPNSYDLPQDPNGPILYRC